MLGVEGDIIPLSQSFVKRYWSYKLGEYCGKKLQLVDLEKKFKEKTKDHQYQSFISDDSPPVPRPQK